VLEPLAAFGGGSGGGLMMRRDYLGLARRGKHRGNVSFSSVDPRLLFAVAFRRFLQRASLASFFTKLNLPSSIMTLRSIFVTTFAVSARHFCAIRVGRRARKSISLLSKRETCSFGLLQRIASSGAARPLPTTVYSKSSVGQAKIRCRSKA
jgi:hypothetical protein